MSVIIMFENVYKEASSIDIHDSVEILAIDIEVNDLFADIYEQSHNYSNSVDMKSHSLTTEYHLQRKSGNTND